MSNYRLKLPRKIRNNPALLIVDGQKRRENPFAIKLLKENNISTFVLPSHISHVTQMLDVGIASSFKFCFSEEFHKLLKLFDPNKNHAGQLREFCIRSAIYAWDAKAKIKSCMNAAKLTSTYPFDANILIHNKFVGELSNTLYKLIEKKKKKPRKEAININSKLISDDTFLAELNEYIKTTTKHSHLNFDNYSGDYLNTIVDLGKLTKNSCYFLSTMPNFIDEDLHIHFFD